MGVGLVRSLQPPDILLIHWRGYMPESGCQGITQHIVSRLDLGANKDLLGSKN